MNRKLSMCVSALGLTLLLQATPLFAFEPMPPIMQKLLEVFPEENGRFVDEPFGSIESMPKEARPLFETFRVVVPTADDIDKNLARLFSASSHFPIKKITRYDKDPGAPGLPGFRGAWCQTEDDSQVGFSIVTINQNRFLIWAKMWYYPAFATDSINPKARDQYARDVSQYLAGIDFKVPDNEAPQASGRGLPEWMGLYPTVHQNQWSGLEKSVSPVLRAYGELDVWGLSGVRAFKPTPEALERVISEAPDTVVYDHEIEFLQNDLQAFVSGYYSASPPFAFREPEVHHEWPGVPAGGYKFAVDRFGRIRMCGAPDEGETSVDIECLFPATGVISAGWVRGEFPTEAERALIPLYVTTYETRYYYSMARETPVETVRKAVRIQILGLGHFLAALKQMNVAYRDVLIARSTF